MHANIIKNIKRATLVVTSLLLNLNYANSQHLHYIPTKAIRHAVKKIPAINGDGQEKVELVSGNLDSLKSSKKLRIKYDYETMAVCSYTSEAEFLEAVKTDYEGNLERVDLWEWETFPKNIFEPKFELLFNKYAGKVGYTAYKNDTLDSEATLIVKVLKQEPHFHKNTPRPEPHVLLECTFLDREGFFVARFNVKAKSMGTNLKSGLGGCYAVAGKILAKEFVRQIQKRKAKTPPGKSE